MCDASGMALNRDSSSRSAWTDCGKKPRRGASAGAGARARAGAESIRDENSARMDEGGRGKGEGGRGRGKGKELMGQREGAERYSAPLAVIGGGLCATRDVV